MPKPSLQSQPVPGSRSNGRIRGDAITPSDPRYDSVRGVFYTGFDARPDLIIRPLDAEDVVSAVALARESGAPLAVRSGGHSVAGHSVQDGGIVLDLSSLRDIGIDAERRTAWAQTGLTAGAYTAATGAHGLATGFGDAPSVGIGGITLGGGVGFLHRKLGLTLDSLLAAELVTAAGEILYVDADSHPDLFWAIRGGGGNFGVATRFHFRLHEVDEATGGMLLLPATPDRIVRFVAALEEAPEELSGVINVMLAPPMPFIPAEHVGKPVILGMLLHAGPAAAGEQVLSPFRKMAPPIADLLTPMRYAQIYEGEGEPPRPSRMAVHSFFTDAVDRAAGEAILEHLQRSTAPMRVAQFRVLGGAVARVPPDATAFAHRDRAVMAVTAAAYQDLQEGPQHAEWAARFATELRRGEPAAYVGFLGAEGEHRVREAYPRNTWERLRTIKRRYDPDNLFQLNQNVPPGGRP